MIDVNKITSTLAKLPDQQLQQYAQMHKNDPYIMALAMSESNRRKELRAASQRDQGAQEQPKVVDQVVAEMAPQQLPEEMGIGQLPVGEMNFAGGGIIAFADGGDVERYSGEFGSLTGLSPEFAGITVAGEEPLPVTPDLASMRRVASSPYVPRSLNAEEAELLKRFPKPPSAPKAPPKVVSEERALAAERPSAIGGPSGLDALQQKYFGNMQERQEKISGMRAGLVQGIKDLTAANLADVDAEIAARGDVYKGREERLSKQEKELAGMGDRYLGLSLLQAGAAMMSTPGGLAAALGKGVTVGADRYAAGLEKINAAQAKFAEARDRLDDLRINRDDMNAKDRRAALRESRAADLKGLELFLSGAEKDWGVERDVLGKLFTAANADLQTTRKIQAQRDSVKQDTNEKMRSAVFNELQARYPNDPAKVAAEFNKTFSKTEDLDAYFRKQQLDKLAEAKVKMASMGGVGIAGQAEQLAALERQLVGGGGNQVKVASRADIAATAKSSGKTEQQVIDALKARGYTIQ